MFHNVPDHSQHITERAINGSFATSSSSTYSHPQCTARETPPRQ
jgi:hypothetical protein